jgi:DNA-binding XRE family transcriptional regulator
LPGLPLTLKSLKNNACAADPQKVGEHIKRKRQLDHLTQKQAGLIIGVDAYTVLNWEKDKTTPSPKDWPGIIRFLGYVPLPQPVTLAERLYYVRCIKGWSLKEAGHAAGIHEETWGYWERGQNLPQKHMKERIEQFLALVME